MHQDNIDPRYLHDEDQLLEHYEQSVGQILGRACLLILILVGLFVGMAAL